MKKRMPLFHSLHFSRVPLEKTISKTKKSYLDKKIKELKKIDIGKKGSLKKLIK